MIYGQQDTKATLMARGICESDADELLRFRDLLPSMASVEAFKNLSPERRAEVTAYMLGQDSAAHSAAFRAALDRSLSADGVAPHE